MDGKKLEDITKNSYFRRVLLPTLGIGAGLGAYQYFKNNVLDKKPIEEQNKYKRIFVDAVGAGAGLLVAEAVNKYK
ncbi:TPA: hypothetical protein HA235_04750 [Candidatus Woesearchaeota archaeon]|nr:hypothetical protein [Candidatus Woesearchaeota archaeon]HIH54763.1 hypothetical protein [Candidatus Woesearchaeota archaeon]HIJ01946.1 hypothetical protein [Candidatus Woesearchaeota archaeon]HIJ14764.1 hypothetical protein [Candidatus Woesearchaeota archaeon]